MNNYSAIIAQTYPGYPNYPPGNWDISRFKTYVAAKKQRRSSRGFLYWSMLSEDLRVAILCRLKYKQLIRLKCVSKSWHLLISSRCAPIVSSSRLCGIIMTKHMLDMPGSYLEACSRLKGILMQSTPFLRRKLDILLKKLVPFLPQPEEVQDCCNGVLLIAHFAKSPRKYYVCNPTTHQCIEVPVNMEHRVHTYKASLLLDPKDGNAPNSFVVVVPREYSKHSIKLDMFLSRLGNWSSCIVPLDFFLDGSKLIERCVYLKETLYMLSADKYLVSISFTGMKRKSSDSGKMLSATSRAIELPWKKKFDSYGSFGVSKGNLFYSNSDSLNIVVWVLENGERWVLQHRINVMKLASDSYNVVPACSVFCESGGLLKVCAFHPYSDEIFIAGGPLQILKYNPITKKLRHYHSVSLRRRVENVFPVSYCAATLDSV